MDEVGGEMDIGEVESLVCILSTRQVLKTCWVDANLSENKKDYLFPAVFLNQVPCN